MSLVDTLLARVGRPAGRALDPTIRDLVQQVLKEHGYASPAEVQALRDEVRDMRTRVDGMARRLDELTRQAETARGDAAARSTEANAAAVAAGAGAKVEIAALATQVAELQAQLAERAAGAPAATPAAVADATPAEPTGCKVPGCPHEFRSKGFCSPHYQQWRRGTLKGFVAPDGHVAIGDQTFRVKTALAGGLAELRGETLYVDGQAV